MASEMSELKLLNRTVKDLYATISFVKGKRPDLPKMKSLFMPEAKLINNTGSKPVVMTLVQFTAVYLERLRSGLVTSFEEKEVSHVTELFGKIAHRFSTYETRFDLTERKPFRVGINSFQFIKSGDRWLVASLVWNDQTERLKIPRKYLK